jgi:excinuclease ABC subunit B
MFVTLQYKRNDQNFVRGTFRVRGENLEIFPSHLEDRAWRLSFDLNKLNKIEEFDPLTGDTFNNFELIKLYANSHYITPKPTMDQAIK